MVNTEDYDVSLAKRAQAMVTQGSGRFTHWGNPIAYPFYDIILRDTRQGGCFDLSVLLEDYTGSVFLRDEHVIEMARQLGMATESEVSALRDRIAELEEEQSRLPEAQKELKNGLDYLVGEFQRNLRGDSAVISVGSSEPIEEQSDIIDVISETERKPSNPFSL